MTYPDDQTALTDAGDIFTAEGVDADKVRERLASIGMDWFRECQSARNGVERQWYLNYAFFSGNQNVQFRQSSGNGPFDLYIPSAPYYIVRLVINQVRKIIRKEISRLTAQKPNAFVVPASSEDADVFAAQAGEQIWDSLWRRLHLNKTLREAVFWQAVTGNAFIKSYWDAEKLDRESEKYGDISIDYISPFYIFVPDLMLTDIEQQPYVIHAQVRTKSWVKQTYGFDATANASVESVNDNLKSAMGVMQDNKTSTTTVLEVWVKPGYLPELPKGGMFTIAANKIVQGFATWPYDHGEYPFAKLGATLSGKFYNTSIIEDLIPLQRELNRSRSQLIESKNKMSKPQLLSQKGAVDPKRITTEPGLVIEYNLGFDPPQPLPLQGLPSYVTEEISRLYDDMADISGQHEVSNGSTPPGVTAATAISFLQEQDEGLIATNYSSIEEALEKVAAQCLVYVKMYWDEARTVKVVGLEGTFDVQTFKNSSLRGNCDIRIESGSALPTSRAAKQAFVMDLMKMGFIEPEEGLEILEVGGLNKIYERIQVDKRQAQRENLKMRVITEEDMQRQSIEWDQQDPKNTIDPTTGQKLVPPLIVPVNTYDNHDLHIKIHNNYRKSQNFENASSVVRMVFEEHVKQHQEAISGMMLHPLTGMEPSDPHAPDPETEQDTIDQMAQDDGTQQSTGPAPMPEMSGDPQVQ